MSGTANVFRVAVLSTLMFLVACGPGLPGPPRAGSADDSPTGKPTASSGTLKIAANYEPDNLSPKFISRTAGGEFNWVFNSTLTYYDFNGAPHPLIAREIPTQASRDWVINADGTMVTIYRLRQNARWHDGAPLTAHDFVFAHEVYLDPEVAVVRRDPEHIIASVEARDDHTLVINWKEPYVQANLLGYEQMIPLPSHLLAAKYRANKATFASGEEWASSFIGTGPYRVERWEPGLRVIARAHADWLLGPPKIEVLEIRFISDPSTMLANLLAGELDVANSPGLRVSEAVIARDQWVARGEGYLKTWATSMTFLEFQYRQVANWQRAVTDVRVRRALTHAMNRQELADTVTEGLGPPAEVFVLQTDPLYPEVDRAITKYPFDPNRAAALLAEAGWARPQPGGLLTNSAGQTLDIEVMSGVVQEQTTTIIADHWKQVGINSSVFILPVARERDREFRASFTATQLNGRGISLDNFHFPSANLPTPESGYVGLNRGSFRDVEIDRLHGLARSSFDPAVVRQSTVALHQRMSELAGYIPLHHFVNFIIAKHRVKGPVGNYGPQSGITWNVHEWEVTE